MHEKLEVHGQLYTHTHTHTCTQHTHTHTQLPSRDIGRCFMTEAASSFELCIISLRVTRKCSSCIEVTKPCSFLASGHHTDVSQYPHQLGKPAAIDLCTPPLYNYKTLQLIWACDARFSSNERRENQSNECMENRESTRVMMQNV